jgi:hypothetical protein
MDFLKKEILSNIDWTRDIDISDERRFCLHDDSRRMWVQRGLYNDETFVATEKISKGIMVWAAIGRGYKSKLVFIQGNLDSQRYVEMLNGEGIFEDMKTHLGENFHFQQDGAPAHRSRFTVAWITERVNLIPDWPPNSPDLSPIENVWGLLKTRVAARNPQNIAELKIILMDEWEKLSQDTIDSLIDSIPKRFKLAIENQGQCISAILHKIRETFEGDTLEED